MNAFYEHHKNSIRFQYRCFDRILLNGLIQPFQQEQRVVGFFGTYRDLYPVSRDVLREIATQFQNWVVNRSKRWGAPILDAPEGRRDDFVLPYFTAAKTDQAVCILKAREPARIVTAIGTKKENRWHLELKQRWVHQYNFYINDSEWGRMFVRVCPYFPFSARVCLNQHHWIANRLKQQGVRFRQSTNAFSSCADPKALQEIADSLAPGDLSRCGRKWLAQLTPFFTARERKQAGDNVTDYGVGKALENMPELKEKLSGIIDRYHDVQQDILESFVDRGQLQTLIQPTILPNGKRIPGLKLDHPRQLALMHALVRFSHLAAQDSFSTAEVHADTAKALGRTTADYTLGSLRYDLSKLRAKGLVQRLDKSRRYRLTVNGYRICVVYLKLFEKLYAPLTSAILKPFKHDRRLVDSKTSPLDKLYRAVAVSLDQLVDAVGLIAA